MDEKLISKVNTFLKTYNEKLIAVRKIFDQYNLISALHSYFSLENNNFEIILPPLVLLSTNDKKDLIKKLENLKFKINKNIAA